MDILDLTFYYLVRSLKQFAPNIPHSATVYARCKLLNIVMSGLVGIRIDKGNQINSVFPVLEKLNGSFTVLPNSLSEKKDYCLFEPRLRDENGNILFEMRKSLLFDRVIVKVVFLFLS